jgi:hypothetical protein
MPGTRRVPLARQVAGPIITPKAIEIYAELQRVARARRRATDCTISKFSKCSGCRTCETWWDLQDALHRELGLPVWIWPCVPRNPYPPGSLEARAWRPSPTQQKTSGSACGRAAGGAQLSRRKKEKPPDGVGGQSRI